MQNRTPERWWMIPHYATHLRAQSDDETLRHCRFDAFRGPGPGGQKRNKTSSAIRIVHEPTGTTAIAGESRSQAQNRAVALRRLRHRMALRFRESLDPLQFTLPDWFRSAPPQRWLDVSHRSADYLRVMGLVLDVLAMTGWRISDAARSLGLSTGKLARFLAGDDKLLAHVNESRSAAGLKQLRSE